MILYHGSPVGELTELKPFLSEHGRPYLYFADNPLVALLYACRDVQGTEQPMQINCAYTCMEPVKVDTVSEIPDLHAFFKEQEEAGRFRIKPREEISEKEMEMSVSALRKDMLQYSLKEQPTHAMSIFQQSHFPKVWKGECEK